MSNAPAASAIAAMLLLMVLVMMMMVVMRMMMMRRMRMRMVVVILDHVAMPHAQCAIVRAADDETRIGGQRAHGRRVTAQLAEREEEGRRGPDKKTRRQGAQNGAKWGKGGGDGDECDAHKSVSKNGGWSVEMRAMRVR